MDNEQLGQRSSSRRQRRADREAADPNQNDNDNGLDDEDSHDSPEAPPVEADTRCISSSTGTDTATSGTSRGPSDEIERLIAASIAKRTQSNAAAARNEAHHDQATTPDDDDHNNHNTNNIYDHDDDTENEIVANYEYLDHTADIQIHSWGTSLARAMEDLVLAMFGYQTRKLSLVDVNESDSVMWGSQVTVQAHDTESLVFQFLQEWLGRFHVSKFIPRYVTIESLDLTSFSVTSSGRGERMRPEKHLSGTEVKAVTYSNLQVITNNNNNGSRVDIWVILDI